MDNQLVDISQARIAASLLLVVYLTVAVILMPRELAFLKTVKKPFRAKFIVQDIFFQVTILSVLLPPILTKMDNMIIWKVFGVGFFGLWLAVLWMTISRYLYTYKFLVRQHDQVKDEITKLQQQASMESEKIE